MTPTNFIIAGERESVSVPLCALDSTLVCDWWSKYWCHVCAHIFCQWKWNQTRLDCKYSLGIAFGWASCIACCCFFFCRQNSDSIHQRQVKRAGTHAVMGCLKYVSIMLSCIYECERQTVKSLCCENLNIYVRETKMGREKN